MFFIDVLDVFFSFLGLLLLHLMFLLMYLCVCVMCVCRISIKIIYLLTYKEEMSFFLYIWHSLLLVKKPAAAAGGVPLRITLQLPSLNGRSGWRVLVCSDIQTSEFVFKPALLSHPVFI